MIVKPVRQSSAVVVVVVVVGNNVKGVLDTIADAVERLVRRP